MLEDGLTIDWAGERAHLKPADMSSYLEALVEMDLPDEDKEQIIYCLAAVLRYHIRIKFGCDPVSLALEAQSVGKSFELQSKAPPRTTPMVNSRHAKNEERPSDA